MTKLKIVFGALALCFAINVQSQGVAVIELFTSQGCSSCPAADKTLTTIIEEAGKNGKEVYGLSFHVDYWDYIGWKDPYASKDFTTRQKNYWNDLKLSSVYTPQAIVNGQSEFVGSDEDELKKSIEGVLKQSPAYHFTTLEVTVKRDEVSIRYSLDKAPANEVVNFAFVSKKLANLVSAGENNGKRLSHDNVVRAFKTVPVQQQGILDLKFPGINLSRTTLIAYVQDARRKVIAATSTPLSEK